MDICGGTLLVHSDGEPAACTEELEGRCCAGPEASHLGGQLACEDALGPGGCEVCAMEAWTPRLWRHAVHVGTMARTARLCRVHTRPRRVAQVAAEEVFVIDSSQLGRVRSHQAS